jgi:predicted MFS family arabinose efflux permease
MAGGGRVGAGAARALFGQAAWRRWFLAATCARLAGTMAVMSLVFSGRWATGQYADGAFLAMAYGVGAAVGAPFRGQALDRQRLPRGLVRALLVQAGLLALLTSAVALRLPLPVLLVLTALAAVMPAGVPGAFRALLGRVVPPERQEAAFALDAVLLEVAWILGPALASGIAASAPAVLSLALMVLIALLAAAFSRSLPVQEPAPDAGPVRFPSAWREPGVTPTLLLGAVVGISWGAVEAGMPARLVELGARGELWGAMVMLLSTTSIVGGLVYAQLARPARSTEVVRARVQAFLALWGLLLLPLLWTQSVWGIAAWIAAAGLVLAPLTAVVTYLLQRTLPERQQVEGFSLYYAAFALGMGVGSGLAGLLLARGLPRGVLLLSAGVPLLAAGLEWVLARATRGPRSRAAGAR